MKLGKSFSAMASILIVVLCAQPPATSGQQKKGLSKNPEKLPAGAAESPGIEGWQREMNRQDAISTLLGLADDVHSDANTASSSKLQAQVADALWKVDQPASRRIFRQAFDALRHTINEKKKGDSTNSAESGTQSSYAAALREVLQRFGTHDRNTADEWLKQFEGEDQGQVEEQATQPPSRDRMDLLASIALEMVDTNPEQALRTGIRSLSGDRIPQAFGRLLFALGTRAKSLSNTLLKEAITNMRRNNHFSGSALASITNYVFDGQGRVSRDATAANAPLVVNYLIDATAANAASWREVQMGGGTSPDDTRVRFFEFMISRGAQIVRLNAPDKLQSLQTHLNELATGMSQQQLEDSKLLASFQEAEAVAEEAAGSNSDAQLRHAEKENNSQRRNALYRMVAVGKAAGGDMESGLAVASKIDDVDLRAQTEDDIRLPSVAKRVATMSHGDARAIISKFNDYNLKARLLSQLAGRVIEKSNDLVLASDILSEAYEIAGKGESSPDKIQNLLFIAEKFAKFDQPRAFDVLGSAVKTGNQLQEDAPRSELPGSQNRRFHIMIIAAVGGREFRTGEKTSTESIDFMYAADLARADYNLTKSYGHQLKNKLLRAKFMLAVARTALDSARKSVSGMPTSKMSASR